MVPGSLADENAAPPIRLPSGAGNLLIARRCCVILADGLPATMTTINLSARGRLPLHGKNARMPVTRSEGPGGAGVAAHTSRWGGTAVASAWRMARRWKASLGFALLDQGMTSFANFVQFAIAARVLPIDDFGKYSIVWAFSMLVVPAATALIVEPLPAITSSRRPSLQIHLLAAATRLSILLGCVLAVLVTIGALVARAWFPAFSVLLLCLAVTSPLQQLQFASRRFCYLLRRESVAAASAAAYAAVLLGGVIGLRAADLCTVPGFILLAGAASLAATAVGIAKGCLPLFKVRPLLQKWLIKRCWHMGRWLAGSSIAVWMSGSIILPITAAIIGPAASGIFRAESILFQPIYQFWWAMAALLIPRVAEVAARQPANHLWTTALQIIATLGALATAYSTVLLVGGSDLLMLVYHKPEIAASSRLLWPLSICTIVDAVAAAAGIVLIANGVTRFIFWARVASAAVLLVGAFWLGPTIGLDAIAWAATAGSAVCASIHILALATALRPRHSHIGIPPSGTIPDLAMKSPPSLDGRGAR